MGTHSLRVSNSFSAPFIRNYIVRQRVPESNPSTVLRNIGLACCIYRIVPVIGRVAQADYDRHLAFDFKCLGVLIGHELHEKYRLLR